MIKEYGKRSYGAIAKTSRRFHNNPMRQAQAITALRLVTKTAEKKTHDTFTAGTSDGMTTVAIFSTEQIYCLNNPATGTEIYERVGRRCRGMSLSFRGRLVQNFSNPTNQADECARIVIVYDRQGSPTGAAPTWADVFTSVGPAAAIDASAWAFTNPSNYERFLILADETLSMPLSPNSTNVATDITNYKANTVINRFIKLKNLTSHYSSVAASASNFPTTGAIYLMVRGIQAFNSRAYDLHFCSRWRYTDV